jgi:putative endonuclease
MEWWILRILEFMRGWLAPRPIQGPLGERGERWTARYLRRRGYLILEQQCRDRMAEADLVAYHRGRLVVVEVKTRSRLGTRRPEHAVNRPKQMRLSRFVDRYAKRHHLENLAIRFDVVALIWPPGRRHPEIRHFKSAFRMPD